MAEEGRYQVSSKFSNSNDKTLLAWVQQKQLKKYSVVDLSAGAGGFSLGLKDTNRFNSILANDIDMDMCEIYSLNFPKTKILSKLYSI